MEASYKAALAVLIAASALVPLLGLLYCCRFSRMDQNTNYGALLDGTRVNAKEKSRWILLYPTFFFGRRIAFTLSVLHFGFFLWA